MKKIAVALLACASLVVISCEKDDEKVISENKLPQEARDFVTTHFAGETITRVVKDSEGSVDYDVRLSNGFSLEFKESGEWKEVEGYGVEVPATILAEIPASILDYTDANHSAQIITKVEINKNSFQIELAGGLEIVFDLNGEFVRYDD